MADKIIDHIYHLKGGDQSVLEVVNPQLDRREPIVVYCKDGKTRLKIGDGIHRYNDLKFITIELDINGTDINIESIEEIKGITNSLKLALISEVAAREESDRNIVSKLDGIEKNIGEEDDTLINSTLKGVVNYATNLDNIFKNEVIILDGGKSDRYK